MTLAISLRKNKFHEARINGRSVSGRLYSDETIRAQFLDDSSRFFECRSLDTFETGTTL